MYGRLALLLLLLSSSEGSTCGKPCAVDATCAGDEECFQCIKQGGEGFCGDGCGMYCERDAHCLTAACPVCKGNMCSKPDLPTPAPTRGNLTCGDVCSTDLECSLGECNQCVISINSSTGHCGAGCGMNCTTNAHCENTACPYCDTYLHTCQKGTKPPSPPTPPGPSVCGLQCVVDSECGGECFQCIKPNPSSIGACGDGCGIKCSNDTHCLNPVCPVCSNETGFCVESNATTPVPTSGHLTCNQACSTDGDCDPKSYCNKCVILDHKTEGVCGVSCGQFCSEDRQCVDPRCAVCDRSSKTCEAPVPPPPSSKCDQRCTVNTDCTGACKLCMAGYCKQGCHQPCFTNIDCGDPGCNICNPVSRTCAIPP